MNIFFVPRRPAFALRTLVCLTTLSLLQACSASDDSSGDINRPGGDEFGRERLVDCLRGLHGGRPEAVLEHLLAAVKDFSGGTPQGDDVTALVLRYRGQG
jgi:hypothetical protein